MNEKDCLDGIKRREFLRTSSLLAASAIFLPLGGYKLFGAIHATQAYSSIPTVMLNNNLAVQMLVFGTSALNGATGERCVSEAIMPKKRHFINL